MRNPVDFLRQLALRFMVCSAMLLMACAPALAQDAAGAPSAPPRAKATTRGVLVDTSGSLTIEQVHAKFEAGEGLPAEEDEIMPTGRGRALWYRLTFPAVTSPSQLMLSVPYPNLDGVDFYRLSASASASGAEAPRWESQRAGDSIPVASWPVPHLYPAFEIFVQPGENRPSYLRVAHSYPVSVHWVVSQMSSFRDQNQQWYLLLGVYVGLVMVIVLMSALQAFTWRDPAHLFFALYVTVFALTHLSLTGLAGEYFWPQNAWWNDRAPLALALLSAAGLHLFLARLVVDRDVPWRSYWLFAMALLGAVIAAGFVVWGRAPFNAVLVPYYLASAVTYVGVAGWYAWHRPRVGIWVLVGIAFALGGAAFSAMRLLGMIPFDIPLQYGAQAAGALEILLLLMALNFRNREQHNSRERVGSLARVDPLTGVASHQVMLQRLGQLIGRQQRDPGIGAVIRIRLGNAVEIRQEYGSEAAQNAVVHAGACISGVAKEGDFVARHRDGDFVLILQGHLTREQLAAIGQRLIARGLAQSPGLPFSLVLQLKLAVAEAPFKALDATALMQALDSVLEELASRAGTALRFVVRPA